MENGWNCSRRWREAFPDVKPIAALGEQASAEQFDAAQRAAQSMHIELRSHKLDNLPFDFDAAFRAIAQDGSRMVLVLSGPTFGIQRAHIAIWRYSTACRPCSPSSTMSRLAG